AGDFTGNQRSDLVVLNQGAHAFSALVNDTLGGYADPNPGLITSTSDGLLVNDRPGALLAADFNGDGALDVAILIEDRSEVWVFKGNGAGTSRHTASVSAGVTPTGLSAVRNPMSGQLDLLVGNPFGDILRLEGQGDGSFLPPTPYAGTRSTLAV